MTESICFGFGDILIFSGMIVGVIIILLYLIITLVGRPVAFFGPRGGRVGSIGGEQ